MSRKFSFFFFLLFPFLLFADGEGKGDVQIWKSKTKEKVSWESVLKEAESFDVILWGEEHDDSPGHRAQLEFFRRLTEVLPTSLSLEMLEKDQQTIVDEYIKGVISEKHLLTSTFHWKNFTEDYFPLVKHAKETYSPVVCANPPRRYVNALARKGIVAYMDFSQEAHRFLPEAYTLGLHISPDYLTRLRSLFQGHEKGQGPNPEHMILSQFMWDQGMAESISREIYRSGRKVLHLNGRFHSDFEGGIAFRLKKMGHKVLVISAFPEGKEEESNFEKIADFVILTKRR
ncbi:ChaN family lipoprotein [Leptospira idonii]|uniref:Haem-binding uptake Tiki superfamily ChaN domain-containing protein n=1 Tax=Leptospira idonii TaxID=1193500 RepID=A0A4R9M2F4_9LEPT|nr:ChaN family lipoprotein [Leptospira idonii]TGN18958.1 hypothetical protein EHS15_11110 [Leptospira idonii]